MTQISLAVHFINRFLFLFVLLFLLSLSFSRLVMRYIPSSSQLLRRANVWVCALYCFLFSGGKSKQKARTTFTHLQTHTHSHPYSRSRVAIFAQYYIHLIVSALFHSLLCSFHFSLSLSFPACTRFYCVLKLWLKRRISYAASMYGSAEWVYSHILLCDIGSASMVNELALKQQ